MDGREGMALSGSASYYLNQGAIRRPSSMSVGGSGIPPGVYAPPNYRPLSNPSISTQSNVGGGTPIGSAFHVENQSSNNPYGISLSVPPSVSSGDPVKKKRGRPRKYGPNGANMSLGLSPVPSTPSPGSVTPVGSTKIRGRPRGSGWKQRLAPLGEWMNKTAGLAFTPHVLHVGVGEDVAAKILSFAQQRPRALCILSANGAVSVVTLRPPASSGDNVTYEGRFEILCFSGSYLISETGGPRNRDGGLSISVCSPDGHVIGGAIGGRLIASSPVQVVACSFVYGGSKAKGKTETSSKDVKSPVSKSSQKLDDKSSVPVIPIPLQSAAPNSATVPWPPVIRPDPRNPQTELDLKRG